MFFQFSLSHLLRNRQYLPIIPTLHLISTLSWHYIFFCHHNIIHSYLGCSLTYFSTTCYFLKPSKYSRCHINQKLSTTFCTTHFLSHNSFPSEISKYPSSTHLFSNSNKPHNKLFGVNTSDTSYIKHNGRLFNTFSISNKTKENSVNENLSLPIDFFKHFFTIPTNLSQILPIMAHHHVIPCLKQINWLSWDLNTVPLSDMIFFGQSLLAINFLILFMKFLLLSYLTKFRIIELAVAHVNVIIYALSFTLCNDSIHNYFYNKYLLRAMVSNNLLHKLQVVL